MSAIGRSTRINKELERLSLDPPDGVVLCDKISEEDDVIKAKLFGPSGTPYSGGVFHLEMRLSARYPFEAPHVRFATKVYHPNIDEAGRICLDSLKLPPAGSWRPSLNLSQVLSQLVLLLAEPGLSDPLMKEIAELYKDDRQQFDETARMWTERYAQVSFKESMPNDAKKLRLEAEESG